MFTPTWGNDPIWLIFFRWVETTNQFLFWSSIQTWLSYITPKKPKKHQRSESSDDFRSRQEKNGRARWMWWAGLSTITGSFGQLWRDQVCLVLGGGNSNIFGIFIPKIGEIHDPILTCAYFSDGLVQKPPSTVDLTSFSLSVLDDGRDGWTKCGES